MNYPEMPVPCEAKPPTGEPDAGNPHVRFGGGKRRDTNRRFLPLYEISKSSERFFRGFPLRAFFRMTIPKVLFKRGAYDFYGEINVL